jgi:hypothetical protein
MEISTSPAENILRWLDSDSHSLISNSRNQVSRTTSSLAAIITHVNYAVVLERRLGYIA